MDNKGEYEIYHWERIRKEMENEIEKMKIDGELYQCDITVTEAL
jgi:hypothetical protein